MGEAEDFDFLPVRPPKLPNSRNPRQSNKESVELSLVAKSLIARPYQSKSSFMEARNETTNRSNRSQVERVGEEKKEECPSPDTTARPAKPVEAIADAPSLSSKSLKKFSTPKKASFSKRLMLAVLRFVFLDLVLLAPLMALGVLTVVEKAKDNFLLKQMDLQLWTDERRNSEAVYYHRECSKEDVTTHDAADLLIDPDAGTAAAVENMMIHGVSIFPNLLTPETATEVRDFIVTENKRSDDLIQVIENRNRWSFYIQVDQHPAVAKALKEILSHKYLTDTIEAITGPNPAVIEFTGITSAAGAKIQRMHQDVMPDSSAAKFARNFVPSYSLFIPLQNTTKKMGATEICPGTHHFSEGCNEVCEVEAFQASGSEDNWPMGFGALVNQQITHRGPAHSAFGEPERVLFIITFAPRPRFDKNQVETRILGSGGSYSLHWSQWGHTLREFADPEKYMSFPWRYFRSLGIYKPQGSEWGWDYITTASQRILHEDLGYGTEDLTDMIERGKFLLPEWLHGTILDSDNSIQVWTTFLSETLANVQAFCKKWYFSSAAIYFGLAISGSLLFLGGNRLKSTPEVFLRYFRRAAVFHLAVFLMAYLWYRSVANGSWARNITQGIQFNSPSPEYHPTLPGTLPTKEDVLIFEELMSPYLASTAFVFDYAHAGNYEWQSMTNAYADGFTTLPKSLQAQLRADLVEWNYAEYQSRILMKNSENEWAVASDGLADRACHKDLVKKDNEWKRYAVTWIDYLLSEVRFGFWRESAMNKRHIQGLLMSLQDKVMEFKWDNGNSSDILIESVAREPSRQFSLRSSKLKRSTDYGLQPRSALPPRAEAFAPYFGAWLKEGDVVEGNFNSYSGEYYRGHIVTPISDTSMWDVEYDDGEQDVGLCRTCIRPFVPYEIGETAEWTDLSNFFPCQIIGISGEDSYEITLFDDERNISDVSASFLRRIAGGVLAGDWIQVGARVQAQFPGEHALFPGMIQAINADGTYTIAYDDGDRASVSKDMIFPP